MILSFFEYIFESNDKIINIIDDCFLEFCEKYSLEINFQESVFVNDIAIAKRFLCSTSNKYLNQMDSKCVNNGYEVQITKEGNTLLDKLDTHISELNNDFYKCIMRIRNMSNGKFTLKKVPLVISEKSIKISFQVLLPDVQ